MCDEAITNVCCLRRLIGKKTGGGRSLLLRATATCYNYYLLERANVVGFWKPDAGDYALSCGCLLEGPEKDWIIT